MKNKKGISLIVLVITILVMIILAGVVIVSLQDNNPIGKAKLAKLQDSVSSVRSSVSQYAATAQASDNVKTEMEKIYNNSSACSVTGYSSYYRAKTTSEVKKLLGVDLASVEGASSAVGEFYITQNGATIFLLKDENIAKELGIEGGTTSSAKEKDGIVYAK